MDRKVELLKEYYRGLPRDRAKIETYEHGFEYVEGMLTDGMTLEYGEASMAGLLYKYKFSNIPEGKMDELLLSHVRKARNVCLYFDDAANDLFCFNLDNNHKVNNTVIIPEMELAVRLLRDILTGLGCEPLVVASGRGYHLWCRLAGRVENGKLYDLMLRAMARTLYGLHQEGLDHNKIKANFYPDPRIQNTVSLRLFGSEHTKNKVFSRVFTGDALLDEEASWSAFENHMNCKTMDERAFHAAFATITGAV